MTAEETKVDAQNESIKVTEKRLPDWRRRRLHQLRIYYPEMKYHFQHLIRTMLTKGSFYGKFIKNT